jgi:subtilase family serine protease
LAISALGIPSKGGAGDAITAHDSTQNAGNGAVKSSTTQYYLSQHAVLDGTAVLLGERTVKSLLPGSASSGSVVLTIPDHTDTGSYYIIADADGPNAIAESNESNNVLAKKIAIGPNLTLSSVTAPSSAPRGGTIAVGDVTVNRGGGSDNAITNTGFYLSTTSTKLAIALGERSVPVLGAGASNAGTINVTIPADVAPGEYYIVANADDGNAVTETSEGDNKRSARITITP